LRLDGIVWVPDIGRGVAQRPEPPEPVLDDVSADAGVEVLVLVHHVRVVHVEAGPALDPSGNLPVIDVPVRPTAAGVVDEEIAAVRVPARLGDDVAEDARYRHLRGVPGRRDLHFRVHSEVVVEIRQAVRGYAFGHQLIAGAGDAAAAGGHPVHSETVFV